MAVGTHCKSAAVAMADPPAQNRNIYATFNASGCEQMAQIVVREPFYPELGARPVNRFLTFPNDQDMIAILTVGISELPRIVAHVLE